MAANSPQRESESMRVVFMGTPEFAVPSLQALLEAGHDVCAVVTQPDRPAGRGQSLRYSPVKQAALDNALPVLQPKRVSADEFMAKLRELKPEVVVVVAFGQKIPREILELPQFGCINVHGSLLPRYRGASPIHWAIIDGNHETGVTTMLLNEGWDTGDMLLQETVSISSEDTAGTLHDKLSTVGAELLVKTLAGLQAGSIRPRPQDDSQANYVRMLKKEDGLIDWSQSAQQLVNFVRGMQPWPVAYSYLGDRLVKVWWLEPAQSLGEQQSQPGTVMIADGNQMVVSVGDGAVRLVSVQPESGKKMPAGDFVNGYRVKPGDRFGSK